MSSPAKEPRPMDFAIFQGVEETSEAERTTHEASCHCEAIKYTVTLKWPFPKYPVNTCNCSICERNSYLLVYPCRRDIVFSQGEDNMQSYVFGTKQRIHKFCKTCGSSLMIDLQRELDGAKGPENDQLAVNVRNFKNIDLNAMDYTFFDGKNKI